MLLTPYLKLSQVKLQERYTFRTPLIRQHNGTSVDAVGMLVEEKIKKQSAYSPSEHVTGTLLTVGGNTCGESHYIEVSQLAGLWEETLEEAALQLVRTKEREEQCELVRQCINILKKGGFNPHPFDYSRSSVSFDDKESLTFLLTLLQA